MKLNDRLRSAKRSRFARPHRSGQTVEVPSNLPTGRDRCYDEAQIIIANDRSRVRHLSPSILIYTMKNPDRSYPVVSFPFLA